MNDGESPLADEEELYREQQFLERMLFGLRTNRGVDVRNMALQYQCQLDKERADFVQGLIADGLLIQEGDRIKTSLKGRLLLDEISARLI